MSNYLVGFILGVAAVLIIDAGIAVYQRREMDRLQDEYRKYFSRARPPDSPDEP